MHICKTSFICIPFMNLCGMYVMTSSKLWHSHLCHISWGRIDRLIKEEILHPLDFSNFDQCIECIKGKFAKQIKKGVV
jgi:hypothetical protein